MDIKSEQWAVMGYHFFFKKFDPRKNLRENNLIEKRNNDSSLDFFTSLLNERVKSRKLIFLKKIS